MIRRHGFAQIADLVGGVGAWEAAASGGPAGCRDGTRATGRRSVDGWRLWQAELEGRAWAVRAGNGRLGSATTTQTEKRAGDLEQHGPPRQRLAPRPRHRGVG